MPKQRKIKSNGRIRSSSVVIKMDGNSIPWPDLPQGIVETIINKLHFVDQVRALAVCKRWRACKDYVKTYDCLPWVMCRERGSCKSVICYLIDPYSQKVFPKGYKGHSYYAYEMAVDSRHGWLLLSQASGSFLLHNPFTRDVISVPPFSHPNEGITMKVSSKPPECEIFALTYNDDSCIIIETGRFSKDGGCLGDYKSHIFDFKGGYEKCLSMLYMNVNIYALFLTEEGILLNSYSLEDESCQLLTEGFPESYESLGSMYSWWLMEMNENLMMVRLGLDSDGSYKWTILRFDWSEMSWVVETGLKSYAIFIDDRVAFSRPLTDRDGKKSEECKLFYGNRTCGFNGFKCCSLKEAGGGTQIQSHEYERIDRLGCHEFHFVEPPYFGI